MLSYNTLKDRPRDFLAVTGLTLEEFQQLLPAFQEAYEQRYPTELTRTGKPRQRRAGGGAKGVLQYFEPTLSSPNRKKFDKSGTHLAQTIAGF